MNLTKSTSSMGSPPRQRTVLMERMIECLGVNAAQLVRSERGAALLRGAAINCLYCRDAEHCRAWLDGAGKDRDYQSFCPNAGLFDRLHD